MAPEALAPGPSAVSTVAGSAALPGPRGSSMPAAPDTLTRDLRVRFARSSLAAINQAAVAYLSSGDAVAAAAAFGVLFDTAAARHATHPDMHAAHANCAQALLQAGRPAEALAQAARALQLLREAEGRGGCPAARHQAHRRIRLRTGRALLALERPRAAAAALEAGLAGAPECADLAAALAQAHARLCRELLEGKHLQRLALPAPPPLARLTAAPHGAALRRAGQLALAAAADPEEEGGAEGGDLAATRALAWQPLPSQLLRPAQALQDAGLCEAFTYARVHGDVCAPRDYLVGALRDGARAGAMAAATRAAVAEAAAAGRAPHVLLLGCGAGLLALEALAAGAAHVTCVDRHTYLAAACRDVLAASGVDPARVRVLCRDYESLCPRADVPIPANILVFDAWDDGVLTCGVVPAGAHALDQLLVREGALLVPRAVTVLVAPAALPVGGGGPGSGLPDLGPGLERHRWWPAPALPAPLAAWAPGTQLLAPPKEAWHFDLGAPPEGGAIKTLDLEFDRAGRWAAVAYWARLHLWPGGAGGQQAPIVLETGQGATSPLLIPQVVGGCLGTPGPAAAGPAAPPASSLQPALAWLPGVLPVEAGQVLPLACAHNTVGLSFTLEEGEYAALLAPLPALPASVFKAAGAEARLAVWRDAITEAIARLHARGRPAHVLDIGTGPATLALLAAAAGADSVTAVELQEPLAAAARRSAAAAAADAAGGSGPSSGGRGRVTVVAGDVARLRRSPGLLPEGATLILADVADAGLLGGQALYLLACAQRHLAAEGGAAVLPAAATVWALGVELRAAPAPPPRGAGSSQAMAASAGADLSPLDAYWWREGHEAIQLDRHPARPLTRPSKVFGFDFGGGTTAASSPGSATSSGDEAAGSTSTSPAAAAGHPEEAALQLEVEAAGRLAAVVSWFDLDLGGGRTLTSAPPGYAPGGHPGVEAEQPGGGVAGRHWVGQALHCLDAWAPVMPGQRVPLQARRQGPAISFALPPRQLPPGALPAPKAPWLAGSGIGDPAVWAVRRCTELQAGLLQRAPSALYPPIWRDLALITAHAGSLGLAPGPLGRLAQRLSLEEGLAAVAERGRLDASPAATAQAAAGEPLEWR